MEKIEFRTIVCGIDTSPQSLDAARQALAVGGGDTAYWGVSVWDPALAFHAGIHMAEVKKDLREESQGALQTLSDELPQVQPLLVQGKELAGLLGAISNLEADLVCVGASGSSRPAGIVFGSVATALAHHAPCSVLVARKAKSFPGVIVHANDGSVESLEAGRVAARIAGQHATTLVTLHIDEGRGEGVSEEAAEMMDVAGVEPILRVEQGSPHRRIVEIANEIGASLIVMGSRGQTGLASLGSVSERVAHRADCSVLIVRQPSRPVFGADALG